MKKKTKEIALTIPSYRDEPTSDPDVVRLVDFDGNWQFYKRISTGRVVPAVNYILRNGFSKGDRFQKWLLSVNEDEANKILESAGDRGSRVHKAIRDLIDGLEVRIDTTYPSEVQNGRFETLTNEEWGCVRGFVNWFNVYRPAVVAQEVTVFSNAEGYAGTIDFLGTIKLKIEDKEVDAPILIDWKTSSGIWDEYKLQVAAYFQAWYERPNESTPFLPTYTAIVRIGTKHKAGFEMKLMDARETMANYSNFMYAKSLCEFVNDPEKSKPEIEQIPTSFKINVPKWVSVKPAEVSAKARPRKPRAKQNKSKKLL